MKSLLCIIRTCQILLLVSPSLFYVPAEASDISDVAVQKTTVRTVINQKELAAMSASSEIIDLMLLGAIEGDADKLSFFPRLERLDLSRTDAGEATFAALSHLAGTLIELNVSNLRTFNDDALRHLLPLKELKTLKAHATYVCGINLDLLSKENLPNLGYLDLSNTHICDAHLPALAHIETVVLDNSFVTEISSG